MNRIADSSRIKIITEAAADNPTENFGGIENCHPKPIPAINGNTSFRKGDLRKNDSSASIILTNYHPLKLL